MSKKQTTNKKVRTEEAKKQVEWARLFVRTIKTMHGRRHAVVNQFDVVQELPGNNIAIYSYDAGGLEQAREIVHANNKRKPA